MLVMLLPLEKKYGTAGMLGLIASASLKASRASQWFFGFWQLTPDE
jgi:hypothetical protein